MLKLIKRASAHAVYLNTTTDEYELWVVTETRLVEQIDIFTDLQDALGDLEYESRSFEDFFTLDKNEDDLDWITDIDSEDLTEWQNACIGLD